ncbi:putative pectinesterase/pectinesterase inhibitor 61 [Zea mays]|uniref:Putative pectinesterase/pectinesterase inhibitor 61 n=1 Tax=Zea mays TaxID=4577 RepID=A0A1D6DWT9_MAIZE|nr:putative pectinesterase/pectinesterase inhibitor 61 [Zea mays]
MANKVAVASVIAAVGIVAVIGTIAAVTSAKKAGNNHGGMSASVKLSTVCASTLYPQKCEQSLKPIVNDTSNPEDVLRAAFKVALDEVAAAFQRSVHIGKDAQDNLTRNAMDECKKLLDDATEDLRGMARLKPADVVRHVKDLRVWVSGVMTYVYTCADGFEKPELKEAMDKMLQNSTELSSNALAILTRLGELLPQEAKALNATLPGAGHGRRLLGWQMGEAEEVTSGGRGLPAVNDKLGEIADVANANLKLLSDHAALRGRGVLTTGLVGTFDEIQYGRSGVPPSDFPKWMPASQRRLLQLPGFQRPNKVVAQDGSGDFKTITEAIAAMPKTFEGRFVIYVKAGTYKEYVTVPKDMVNIFMYGDGPTRTVVTGDKSNTGGFATIATRTFWWAEWMGDLGLKTLYYAEYANIGPGAGTSKRVSWPGYRVIGQAEATHFTAGVFIDGMTWLQSTGTPNVMGFTR